MIRELDLSGNQLIGSVPDSIGNLTLLWYVQVVKLPMSRGDVAFGLGLS